MISRIPNTRLDLLMSITGVTGKMLSNHLHLDMSLISRWKTGKRQILNSHYLNQLVDFFYSFEDGYFCVVYKQLINEYNIIDDVVFKQLMEKWIVKPLLKTDLLDSNIIGKNIINNKYFETYEGNKGRRKGVLELTKSIMKLKEKKIIYIISNEESSWLDEDPNFLEKWFLKLEKCVELGFEIKIIHTFNDNIFNLYKNFINWIPLYMTRKVEGYYLEDKHYELPVQSLFLVENSFLVEGYLYTSNLKDRYTARTNDFKTLKSRQLLYKKLLTKSKRVNEISEVDKISLILENAALAGKNKDDSFFKAEELFFTNMPKDLLEDILIQNKVSELKQKFFLNLYDNYNKNFSKNTTMFTNKHIYDFDSLLEKAEKDSFKATLLSILVGKDIIVTKEQFMYHLESTIYRLRTNDKFEIGLYSNHLTNFPLEDIGFWIKEDYQLIMWSKNNYNFIQTSEEINMIRAISYFYEELWKMIPMIDKEKSHVISRLEKVIKIIKA